MQYLPGTELHQEGSDAPDRRPIAWAGLGCSAAWGGGRPGPGGRGWVAARRGVMAWAELVAGAAWGGGYDAARHSSGTPITPRNVARDSSETGPPGTSS
jgi:hypothetical protein